MASKKKCANCGFVGARVRARESNTTGQIGARRCVCGKGCDASKSAARRRDESAK